MNEKNIEIMMGREGGMSKSEENIDSSEMKSVYEFFRMRKRCADKVPMMGKEENR